MQPSVQTSSASGLVRDTSSGRVAGFVDKNNTHAWFGIPYAAPPVGPLRWKAPRPAIPWAGVFEAKKFGERSVQYGGMACGAHRSQWGKIIGSEDCLTLNVFAPPDKQNCPVMFWIHGGGNSAGSVNPYFTLRNLAAQDGVVVVSLNYRLGVLGWLYLPELHDADSTDEDRSGNYGTLDLIAGLKWVRENIASFGGDPENVTIFGESAGGQNVLSLLVSPLAKGLFHKAIAQSPVPEICTLVEAATDSRELLAKWNAASGDLRGKSPQELIRALVPIAAGIYATQRLFRDGKVLPKCSLLEALSDANGWNRVPVILGANRDEFKLFNAQNPDYVWRLPAQIPIVKNRRIYERDSAFMSRVWVIRGTHEVAAAMTASGHKDVWVYRFDWDELPQVPLIRPDKTFGAAHAIEIAFVFRDVDGEVDFFRMATARFRPGRQYVSDAMAGHWVSLARSGNPAAGWDRRGESRVLVFDSQEGGGVRMEDDVQTMAQLKTWLRSSRDFTPRERIQMYARMFVLSIFHDRGNRPEYEEWAREAGVSEGPEAFRTGREL